MKNTIFGAIALSAISCFAQSSSCSSGFATIQSPVVGASAVVNNYDATICGTVNFSVENGGTLNNYAGFSTANAPSPFGWQGLITVGAGGTFNNFTSIYYTNGILINNGNVVSTGNINGPYVRVTNNGAMSLTNLGSSNGGYNSFVNNTTNGMLALNGNTRIQGGLSIANDGYLTNNGSVTIGGTYSSYENQQSISGTGNINNVGAINMQYSSRIAANNIANNGTIQSSSFNTVTANTISGTGTYTMLGAPDGIGRLTVETLTQKSLNIARGIVSIPGAANADVTIGGPSYYGYGVTSFNAGVVNGALTLLAGVSSVGVVNGSVALNGGTLIAANTSLNGDVSITGGALEFDLGNGSNHKLKISGATNISGGSLNINLGPSIYLGETWEVISSAGGIIGFDSMSVGTVTGAYIGVDNYQFTLSSSASSGYITLAAVPEPESYAMLLAGLFATNVIVKRRRDKSRAA